MGKKGKDKTHKNPVGAPIIYPKEIFLEIINIYSRSSIGLEAIIENGKLEGKQYPCRAIFYERVEKDQELTDTFARATKLHDEFMAYETITISDRKEDDYVRNDKGQLVFDKEHVRRSELKVNTRFRLLEYIKGIRNRDKDDTNASTAPSTVINFFPSSQKPKEDNQS